MQVQRPVENEVIYQEEKKDRYHSLAAVPVFMQPSKSSTVKATKPGTEEEIKVSYYE